MEEISEKQKKKILARVIRAIMDFNGKNVGNFAASTSFFFFISLIPILILLSALLPLTGIDEESFVRIITHYTPDVVDGLIEVIIRDAFSSGGKVFSISIIAIIYTAGKGMIALMQGLNVIYGVREHRSYPRIVFVAVIYMIMLLVVIILSLIFGVFAEYLYDFIGRYLPALKAVAGELMAGRLPVIVGSSLVLFLLIYTFVPAGERRFFRQLPGAVFSTVGWMVFSWFFSFFMAGGSIYSTYYGSLATIVIFMLWMYGCFFIILLGGYINVIFEGVVPVLKKRNGLQLDKRGGRC